jgi:5-amino-6-(5-phosphoribosylamino)uracil reductase/diaminohydroxyphosphoribosylaminopyrimidine deaminase/5-amino-6-(5-phosphoribosylamino)uracil reductase
VVPRVTVHYAQSLDGRLATRTGDSQWIGGPASLKLAHQLRAEHAAILVGVGTVLADNPRLTVRLVPGASPRRVIVDSTLRMPLDAHVLTDGAAPTIVATTERALSERVSAIQDLGAEVIAFPADELGRVDLAALVEHIGAESVLIEGGGAVITSALRAGLVHRLVVCIAPLVIGSGTDAVGDLRVDRLRDALRFTSAHFTVLDDDVIFDGCL